MISKTQESALFAIIKETVQEQPNERCTGRCELGDAEHPCAPGKPLSQNIRTLTTREVPRLVTRRTLEKCYCMSMVD